MIKITSLGFDTLIVNNQYYDDDSLKSLFELFSPLNVVNYIFLFNFDLTNDAITVHLERMNKFKSHAVSISPRGTHIKVLHNLFLDNGFSVNPSLKRLLAVKHPPSLVGSFPLFTDLRYDSIAQDVNQLIYRKRVFLLISNFKQVLETASSDFSRKILSTKEIGLGIDINYLLDPAKASLASHILDTRSLFIPTVSHDISNYVGIMNAVDFFVNSFGKKNYFELCRRTRKCSERFGF